MSAQTLTEGARQQEPKARASARRQESKVRRIVSWITPGPRFAVATYTLRVHVTKFLDLESAL